MRPLIEGEHLVKSWGPLNLSNQRIWIEAGDEQNYFINSLELHRIDGHNITKYIHTAHLYMGLFCFVLSPITSMLFHALLKEVLNPINFHRFSGLSIAVGIMFLLLALNYIYKYNESKTLTLNFHAGQKQVYFKLNGEYAKLDQALEFTNLVDHQIYKNFIQFQNSGEKKFKMAP